MRKSWFISSYYSSLAMFTGRMNELKTLNEWLQDSNEVLLMIRALGGFGKSALAWTWFNRVDRKQWPTAIWWSFYEKEAGFENFLSETLTYLGFRAKEHSPRQQVNDLLEAMRGANILIVLDGFERLLRQYGRMDAALQGDDKDVDIDPSQRDCSSPLTETFLRGLSSAGLRSKVLMTTRLCPRVLESADGKLLKGCREELLSAFSHEDAVMYFHNEGIKATRAEIIEVCSAYGYHPLSLSLLVGLINEDYEHRGNIAAVKNLKIFEDVRARRHHVLERAYESLTPERRDLLSKISCFRGSVGYIVLKKVFPSPDFDKALLELRKRGLLQYAGETQRYDMHPIVRHYAYDHFTDEKRKEAHLQLIIYFREVTEAIFATNTNAKTEEDLEPITELFYHRVGAGHLDEALDLFDKRLVKPIYFQFGNYQKCIELLRKLFPDGEEKPPRLKKEDDQAWTLNMLANVYNLSGQPKKSISLQKTQISLQDKREKADGICVGLLNSALSMINLGNFISAFDNINRALNVCTNDRNDFLKGVSHQELGAIYLYTGKWRESENELMIAAEIFKRSHNAQSLCIVETCDLIRQVMMSRDIYNPLIINPYDVIKQSMNVLLLAEKVSQGSYSQIADYVRAYYLIGMAYRKTGNLNVADEYLSKAISMCRQINIIDQESSILLELAKLLYFQGNKVESLNIAQQALLITEHCCYVLQGADVNLWLASLALEGFVFEGHKLGSLGNTDVAVHYAKEALKLATCDGGEYKYKVAYDEASRMLESLE